MSLFVVENLKVVPEPSTLLLYPFKEIWDNDTSSDKKLALVKFAYIEFMCSYAKSNVFITYKEDIRATKIIDSLTRSFNGHGEFWTDELVIEGVKVYKNLQVDASPTIKFFESALAGAKKLTDFFDTFDLTLKTRAGTPVYKPADVTKALKDTNDVIKTLVAMRETIYSELAESSKGKGGRNINYFEKSSNDR